MNITIFGATGMVGKHVVRQALAKGIKANAFGRNIEKLIDADLNDKNSIIPKSRILSQLSAKNAVCKWEKVDFAFEVF